jgi:hypothetical protein
LDDIENAWRGGNPPTGASKGDQREADPEPSREAMRDERAQAYAERDEYYRNAYRGDRQ